MTNLRHDCRRDGCYKDTLPDWSILNGCFPRNIRVTDLDGFVEIAGQFLILEWKRPGAHIVGGQHHAFRALQKTGNVTILVVWGPPGEPQYLKAFTPLTEFEFERAIDLNSFQALVSDWATDAELPRVSAS